MPNVSCSPSRYGWASDALVGPLRLSTHRAETSERFTVYTVSHTVAMLIRHSGGPNTHWRSPRSNAYNDETSYYFAVKRGEHFVRARSVSLNTVSSLCPLSSVVCGEAHARVRSSAGRGVRAGMGRVACARRGSQGRGAAPSAAAGVASERWRWRTSTAPRATASRRRPASFSQFSTLLNTQRCPAPAPLPQPRRPLPAPQPADSLPAEPASQRARRSHPELKQ